MRPVDFSVYMMMCFRSQGGGGLQEFVTYMQPFRLDTVIPAPRQSHTRYGSDSDPKLRNMATLRCDRISNPAFRMNEIGGV
jgi:hypothetical protein